MPWKEKRPREKAASRARRAAAAFREACERCIKARRERAAFAEFLRELSRSDLLVWKVVTVASRDNPLTEEERMQVAEAVNRQLAAGTPAAVVRRRERLKSRPGRGSVY